MMSKVITKHLCNYMNIFGQKFFIASYWPLYCTARRCSSIRRKFIECCINNPSLSLLMKHLVIGQRQKAPNFSAFHWSPHGRLVSTGQHFVTTNINTEIEIEADLNTESDKAMRAVHSCHSWFLRIFRSTNCFFLGF